VRVAIARAIEERLALRHGSNQHAVKGKTNEDPEIFPDPHLGDSRDLAAEKSGFGSGKTYEAAKRAVDGLPEPLVDALDDGRLSIHMAATVAELPKDSLDAIASAPAEQVRDAAKEAIHNHRAQGTGENEWYTPQEFIESARLVLDCIDLDPASSEIAQQQVRAERFFTLADDGLSQPWAGRVFLNPPYAQPAIQQFVEKIVREIDLGGVSEAILLTHNYTDTRWFHHAAMACDAICFTRGRIGFLSPDGKKAAPTQGQAFFYFGPRPERFQEVFVAHGFVVVPT
jgi:ParB family chromosome partitioning protein